MNKAFLFALFSCLFACAPYTSWYNGSIQGNRYFSKKLGISIAVPADWYFICSPDPHGDKKFHNYPFFDYHRNNIEILYEGISNDGTVYITAYAGINTLTLENVYQHLFDLYASHGDTVKTKSNIVLSGTNMVYFEHMVEDKKSNRKQLFMEYLFSSADSKVRLIFSCNAYKYNDKKDLISKLLSSIEISRVNATF